MQVRLSLIVLLIGIILFSCNQEEFTTAPDVKLQFATDTVITRQAVWNHLTG